MSQTTSGGSEEVLFTCLSCSIAFLSPEQQRAHYRSDHHRYNMKRRVAGLPPVSAMIFNEKVLERRAETAVTSSPKSLTCETCKKIYGSDNAYQSHMNSKKHKENEAKAAARSQEVPLESSEAAVPSPPPVKDDKPVPLPPLTVPEDATEEEVERTIEERIAAARSRLKTTDCLFCSTSSPSLEENLTHMSQTHSFFVPDAEYLVDLPGLITYLGEKVVVGNICLYCNGKGREMRSVDAVRKHMIDKSHCKIAYDSERDQLEISDYYDFTSSYPEAAQKSKKEDDDNEEWEDVDEDEDDGEADEIISVEEEDPDDSVSDSSDASDTSDDLPANQITYGDSHLELVLPSGARIGHRSMRRYYAQSFRPSRAMAEGDEDPNSGRALVRRLINDKNSALVPRKGGFGAFGSGTDVVRARNAGEARNARKVDKVFKEQRRREDFRTKTGYIKNNQKHFKDPNMPGNG